MSACAMLQESIIALIDQERIISEAFSSQQGTDYRRPAPQPLVSTYMSQHGRTGQDAVRAGGRGGGRGSSHNTAANNDSYGGRNNRGSARHGSGYGRTGGLPAWLALELTDIAALNCRRKGPNQPRSHQDVHSKPDR
eukprot:scaffold191694_cov32-Prasinocladus_malaysianus.AAC.1